MKAILSIAFTCLSIILCGQTKEDSLQWQELAEQRIAVGKDSVYRQLLRAKQPKNYLNPPSLSYSSASYYTEASRQLLLEVLKDDWITKEQKRSGAEKKVWQQVDRRIDTYENVISDTIKYKGLKRKRKHFLTLLDSLKELKRLNIDTVNSFQTALNGWMQEMDQRRIPDLYIYTAGMLDDDRYIPLLKEALNDTIRYNPYAVKLALARNKVDPLVQEVMENNSINIKLFKKEEDQYYLSNTEIFPVLAYLASDNSIREYSKLLTLEHFECIDHGDYEQCSIPHSTIENLYIMILNKSFRNYLKDYMIGVVPDPKKLSNREITWVQNWLEKNYGNYELDRDFYPGLR